MSRVPGHRAPEIYGGGGDSDWKRLDPEGGVLFFWNVWTGCQPSNEASCCDILSHSDEPFPLLKVVAPGGTPQGYISFRPHKACMCQALAAILHDHPFGSFFLFFTYLLILERGERERERNPPINFLFHLFMHLLVDSCMCSDRESNPQGWHVLWRALTN